MSKEMIDKTIGINFDKVMPRTNGRADKKKLLEMIEAEADAWIEKNEIDEAKLRSAVDRVYAEQPDAEKKAVDLNTLIHRAVNNLIEEIDGTESKLGKHIHTYLKGQSERFINSMGSEGRYHIGRGRGSQGVHLATDSYRLAFREKKASKQQTNDE